MPIKGVVLDVSDTLLTPLGMPARGVLEMIEQLRQLDVQIFTASYELEGARRARQVFGIPYEQAVTWSHANGQRKGGKHYVRYICDEFSLQPNELLYMGDKSHDMYEAVNSGVLYFNAEWANRNYEYGIPTASPQHFVEMVETFFLKDALWYYQLNTAEQPGKNLLVRALLNPDTAERTGIKELLKSKGQRGLRMIGRFSNDQYLSFHLLASIYLEGLHFQGGGSPIWCMYPSSKADYTSALDTCVGMVARLFRDAYWQNLIQRHTIVASSSSDRVRKIYPPMDRQLQSIHLNPNYRDRLNRRSVIVLDDFTTYSHAFETARLYLQNAGVQDVICIAIGKYPQRGNYPGIYLMRTNADLHWDSFTANTALTEDRFTTSQMRGRIDEQALRFFY